MYSVYGSPHKDRNSRVCVQQSQILVWLCEAGFSACGAHERPSCLFRLQICGINGTASP